MVGLFVALMSYKNGNDTEIQWWSKILFQDLWSRFCDPRSVIQNPWSIIRGPKSVIQHSSSKNQDPWSVIGRASILERDRMIDSQASERQRTNLIKVIPDPPSERSTSMCVKNRRKHRFCGSKEVPTRFFNLKIIENIDFAVRKRYVIDILTRKSSKKSMAHTCLGPPCIWTPCLEPGPGTHLMCF